MATYHAYIVSDSDHFIGTHELECINDADAIEVATALLDRNDIELWIGGRKVLLIEHRKKQ